jgi:hypothetical protein
LPLIQRRPTRNLAPVCREGRSMARKPNYRFERLERERTRAAKKAARAKAKAERAEQADQANDAQGIDAERDRVSPDEDER